MKRPRDAISSSRPRKFPRRSSQMASRPIRLSPELKESQYLISASLYGGTTTNGTSLTLINGIAQSTDSNGRIGRKVLMSYVEVDIAIGANQAGATFGDGGFWAVVLDRQPNGSLPTFSSIFDTNTCTTVGLAPKNTLLYQERYLTLKRETWTCGAGVQGGELYRRKCYINLKKLQNGDQSVNFNGTGNTISDMNQGCLYLVFAQISANGAGTYTSVQASTKFRFTDA